jgi:predicted SnoaL-like aldol condensation-catalyzing enzyme
MAKKSKRGAAGRTKAKSKSGLKAGAAKLLAKVRAKVKTRTRAKPASPKAARTAAPKSRPAPARRPRRAAKARRPVVDQLARNKELVLNLYHKLIGEKDYEAARQYMGAQYRQHAPYAADGHTGVAEWLRKFKEAFPEHRYEVKRVIAEGDLVVLHLHGQNGPNPYGESVVDIFRIEDGKVVEHWDIIQAIPEAAENANSMF